MQQIFLRLHNFTVYMLMFPPHQVVVVIMLNGISILRDSILRIQNCLLFKVQDMY